MDDYLGTYSSVPARELTSRTVASMSGKRGRGKAKVNKRQPRTRTLASECVSYFDNGDGTVSNLQVFKPARKRGIKTRRTVSGVSVASAYERRLAQYGSEASVD